MRSCAGIYFWRTRGGGKAGGGLPSPPTHISPALWKLHKRQQTAPAKRASNDSCEKSRTGPRFSRSTMIGDDAKSGTWMFPSASWGHVSPADARFNKNLLKVVRDSVRSSSCNLFKQEHKALARTRRSTETPANETRTRMLRIKSVWSLQTFAVHKHLQVQGGGLDPLWEKRPEMISDAH